MTTKTIAVAHEADRQRELARVTARISSVQEEIDIGLAKWMDVSELKHELATLLAHKSDLEGAIRGGRRLHQEITKAERTK